MQAEKEAAKGALAAHSALVFTVLSDNVSLGNS
jgi:hypothetical protein